MTIEIHRSDIQCYACQRLAPDERIDMRTGFSMTPGIPARQRIQHRYGGKRSQRGLKNENGKKMEGRKKMTLLDQHDGVLDKWQDNGGRTMISKEVCRETRAQPSIRKCENQRSPVDMAARQDIIFCPPFFA